MGDPPSPQLISPPSSAQKSNFPMFYYGLIVVGTVAIILALYKIIIVVRWCDDFDVHGSRLDSINDPGPTSDGGFRNLHVNIVTIFVYKKDEGGDDISCAICLCVNEGEEIRQLPNCKHSFHATCIDLWLYSHMECPLCRSTVEPPDFQRRLVFEQPVNSRRFVVSRHRTLEPAFQPVY